MIITKTDNEYKVTISGATGVDSITLEKGDTKLEGSHLFYKHHDMPATAKSGLKLFDGHAAALGAAATDLIESTIAEFKNKPEIKIPAARAELVDAISIAYDKFDYAREQDYDRDIGFLTSPGAEKEIEQAEKELKDFDIAHPEYAAKIAAEKAAKTARQIQSALNA